VKPIPATATHPKGFTLIEIIITLVAAGIMGAIFINLMGSALDDSWNSVEIVRDQADSIKTMEQIIAEYVQLMNSNPDTALATLRTNHHNQTVNGVFVTAQYIAFNASGDEVLTDPAPGNTLKITVQAAGKDLINILTKSRSSGDPQIRY